MKMKNIIGIMLGLLFTAATFAQNDAISYQAVIVNPDPQQIPGTDITNDVLREQDIALRFTIKNENGSVAYQEILDTATDAYGMVNVFIGSGDAMTQDLFTDINWNGSPKFLSVELDLKIGRGFVFISEQPLTFTPQAFHRNIIATGDLSVAGTANFQSDFIIDGQTTINNGLDVTGDLNINGDLGVTEDLNVGEDIVLGDDLTVNGITDLNNLNVNNGRPTSLSGTLNVDGFTTLDSGLNVAAGVTLQQNLTVTGDAVIGGSQNVGGDQNIGGNQRVTGGQRVDQNQVVSGLQIVGGNQTVGGNQIVQGGQSISGDLNVEGDETIAGNSDVMGIATVRQNLVVVRDTDIGDQLIVGGRTDLLGQLNVTNATNLSSSLDVLGKTTIDDLLVVTNSTNIGGTLDVAGKTTIGQNFQVLGSTNLNASLKVDNGSATILTGTLITDGLGSFNNGLRVNNSRPTVLTGSLDVFKDAFFANDVEIDGMLTVNNNLTLDGLVVSGSNGVSGDHIALFENSGQSGSDGIAVRINTPSLTEDNHFVTFYGQGNEVAGRIESVGDTSGFAQSGGIVYGSKGADYAEWLEKENPSQDFRVGEVVGIKAGKISRDTKDADHVLTISLAPIVLGNMPEESRKNDFEKVGFMGQVPAQVRGKVEVGDYIVASGNNDGYAIAISAENMTLQNLKTVIGKAWSSSQGGEALINVSVGLKTHEWVTILEGQAKRLEELESRIKTVETLSEKLKKLETRMNAIDMN